jgi:hypothetical protein
MWRGTVSRSKAGQPTIARFWRPASYVWRQTVTVTRFDWLPKLQGRLSARQAVECYDLEVRQGDTMIASERHVTLLNSTALWSRVAELARSLYAPGRTIRVTNQVGEMVILIGVAAALRYTPWVGLPRGSG